MTQLAVSEKEGYSLAFDQEFQNSLRVLKAYPAGQSQLRPHPTSRSASEVAWALVASQRAVGPIIAGALSPDELSAAPPPATWEAIVKAFEDSHREATRLIDRLTEGDLHGPVRMPVGPGKVGEVRRGTALWTMLFDAIHHRGQLSVYLRIAGGKVPSIYGPSADEPW